VYHTITSSGGTIDIYYEFVLDDDYVPVDLHVKGRLHEGSSPSGQDSVDIEVYDWTISAWESVVPPLGGFVGVTSSSSSDDEVRIVPLFARHKDSSTNKVRVRFNGTSLKAGTALYVDQIYITYTSVLSYAGVADAIWEEAIADHTSGTTFGGKNQKGVPSETLDDYKATGFSTHAAADVWSVGTRTLTDATNITSDGNAIDQSKIANLDAAVSSRMAATENGSSFTSIPWNASWDGEVQSEVQDAIVANHLDHLLAADYDPANKPGVATALLNELVENDGGVSRFTANALEEAPAGSGATAQQVWEYATRGLTEEVTTDAASRAASKADVSALALEATVQEILTDTGTTLPDAIAALPQDKTGYTLTAAERNSVADAVLSRNVSNVEGSAGEHTLCTTVLAMLESSVSDTTWTIKRTDGSTTHATKTVTTDASADPITGVS